MADPIHDVPEGMERLRAVMARLRDPVTGCPWDVEQSFATIAPYTIEEAYEVADAIARDDLGGLKGELGDLLFQSVFHARIAEEAGEFDLDEVIRTITDKMIDRHPHVFGSESRDKSALDQIHDWEAQKARERARRNENGTLDGVALGLPALMRAEKLQKRAARVGFDWSDRGDVAVKIAEEARELAEASDIGPEAQADEMGDLLFSLANLARQMGIDPEAALRGTNDKFARRFRHMEAALAARGRSPKDSDLAEMEALWNEAKRLERDPV